MPDPSICFTISGPNQETVAQPFSLTLQSPLKLAETPIPQFKYIKQSHRTLESPQKGFTVEETLTVDVNTLLLIIPSALPGPNGKKNKADNCIHRTCKDRYESNI